MRQPADREVAGFCAAALAFGRVASVLNSIDTLFRIMGPHPAAFVRTFDPAAPHPELRAMVHRWTRGEDIAALLWVLRQMLEQAGSIEQFFAAGLEPARRGRRRGARSLLDPGAGARHPPVYGRLPKRPGVCYFFPRPSAGSACKRLNLYLRWMVRRDEIDLGAWTSVSPAQLIVPLDTHVIRLGRCLRLTQLRQPRLADGRRHHAGAAHARSRRSGALRFRAVPRRDDGRVRLRPSARATRSAR